MTFGETSAGRTMARTGLLLKKQLWIWPVVAVVLLAVIGYVVHGAIHRTMEDTLRSQLQTLLTVERSMLEKWLKVQESSAVTMANSRSVRQTIGQLVAAMRESAAEGKSRPGAAVSKTQAELDVQLAKELEPGMSSHDFIGYVVVDKQQRIVAATARDLVGQIVPQYESFLTRALEGKTNVSAPFSSVSIVKDNQGNLRSGAPTMFVCARCVTRICRSWPCWHCEFGPKRNSRPSCS